MVQMKKICVDGRLIGYSGIGTYLLNILPKILTEKESWTILLKKGIANKYPVLKQAEILETDVPVLSKKELLYFHKEVPECDLFWTPHFNMSLRRPKAKKILLTLCDTYHLEYYKTLKFQEKVYTKFLLPRFVRRADHVVTISNFSQREIEKHIPRTPPLSTIYCGVDHSRFQKRTPAVRDIAPYFLTVGTHKKHKNIHGLLRAFEKTLSSHTADLYICGSAKGMHNSIEVSSLIQSEQMKKRIRFLEHVPLEKLPELYQNALGFVFPSFYEGFGLPPLEAMACGCPAIVSKAASLPEVCGDAALYVDPYDIDSIASALVQLTEQEGLRKELQEKGLERARLFTWEEAAKKHLQVIRQI